VVALPAVSRLPSTTMLNQGALHGLSRYRSCSLITENILGSRYEDRRPGVDRQSALNLSDPNGRECGDARQDVKLWDMDRKLWLVDPIVFEMLVVVVATTDFRSKRQMGMNFCWLTKEIDYASERNHDT